MRVVEDAQAVRHYPPGSGVEWVDGGPTGTPDADIDDQARRPPQATLNDLAPQGCADERGAQLKNPDVVINVVGNIVREQHEIDV